MVMEKENEDLRESIKSSNIDKLMDIYVLYSPTDLPYRIAEEELRNRGFSDGFLDKKIKTKHGIIVKEKKESWLDKVYNKITIDDSPKLNSVSDNKILSESRSHVYAKKKSKQSDKQSLHKKDSEPTLDKDQKEKIALFGWGKKTRKDLAKTHESKCPNCNTIDFLYLCSIKTWMTVFYIPIIPYGFEYFMYCKRCLHGFGINANQLDKVKKMKNIKIEKFSRIPCVD